MITRLVAFLPSTILRQGEMSWKTSYGFSSRSTKSGIQEECRRERRQRERERSDRDQTSHLHFNVCRQRREQVFDVRRKRTAD